VTSFVVYSVKANPLPERQACLVRYLQTKGKLSADFPKDIQSVEPRSSDCDFITGMAINVIKSAVFMSIEDEIPDAALCLITQLKNKEAFDYVAKIMVLAHSRSINDTERSTQAEATRSQFKEDLEKIATHCETDDKKFINLFKEILGLKNDSLAVHQYEYCLGKYAVDNKVVELGDVEINPRHIDLDSVDCEQIIEADKSKSAKYFRDANAETFKGEEAMDCAVNAYKNAKIYEWRTAFLVIKNLDFSAEKKEVETAKINEKMRKFAEFTTICSEQSV
jgi:hypothetical protein